MATSKHTGYKHFGIKRGTSRSGSQLMRGRNGAGRPSKISRFVRLGLLVLLLVGAVLLAWSWPKLQSAAITGTAYGARMGCSCRYVGGRSLKDCTKDFEPGMGLVSLWEDQANHAITARVIPLASQTARFTPGQGCVLESWR